MKKTYTLITLLLALFLVACNNTPLPEDLDFSVKFDLTYKLDDGSDYKVYKVKLGETLPVPNEPTKEGYNFDGWYVGDEKFEGTVVEASALTLVARFSPKQGTIVSYNVSFYDDDILLQTISVTHGDNVETTPDTNKEGKNFIGWFVDVDLTIQFSLENKIIEDTIL
ncbi:MAG TPA: InlB B-repeat-containing protein, partial [Acholeplasma sp.]